MLAVHRVDARMLFVDMNLLVRRVSSIGDRIYKSVIIYMNLCVNLSCKILGY